MNFLIGKEQEFYDFLNNLKKEDRIAIITHTDLDGIASAIFFQEILKTKKLKPKTILFVEYGKKMFVPLAEKLKRRKINKVFMSDINESSDYADFEVFRGKFDVFFVDHHVSEIKNKKNILKGKLEDCTAFMLYYLGNKITDLSKWKTLICATMVAEWSYKDENNFKFMKSIYPNLVLESIRDSEPADIAKKIYSGLTYFGGKQKKVMRFILKGKIDKLNKYVEIIKKETDALVERYKKEAEYYPEKDLYFYYYTPKLVGTSSVTEILAGEQKDKTFVFVADISDELGFVRVSSRNQSKKVDLNQLLKKAIEGLENATAGGHIPAAGGKFMKKDLQKFKENLLNAL